mgnify:FL=1
MMNMWYAGNFNLNVVHIYEADASLCVILISLTQLYQSFQARHCLLCHRDSRAKSCGEPTLEIQHCGKRVR